VLSGSTLYGTAVLGGVWGRGTVFKVNTDGTGFVALHGFSTIPDLHPNNTDGAEPYAALVLVSNTLYGTASTGGTGANGTLFSVNAEGSNFQTLYSFTQNEFPFNINNDGASPFGPLILSRACPKSAVF
jgi:uncharacterized repeat protein (TIGR03803 family)